MGFARNLNSSGHETLDVVAGFGFFQPKQGMADSSKNIQYLHRSPSLLMLLRFYRCTKASVRKDGVSKHYSCGALKVFRQILWWQTVTSLSGRNSTSPFAQI
ncbi:uncharacterized protein GJ701_004938 isoform 1-T1 [Geothlypis trichas]